MIDERRQETIDMRRGMREELLEGESGVRE
jgi:hypothetical protein